MKKRNALKSEQSRVYSEEHALSTNSWNKGEINEEIIRKRVLPLIFMITFTEEVNELVM